MNLSNLLGDYFQVPSGEYKFLADIVTFLNQSIMPISITLMITAAIFGVVITFMIIKAESSEKAAEMRKRLFQLIITVVCVIVCVWILGFVLSSMDSIIGFFRGN